MGHLQTHAMQKNRDHHDLAALCVDKLKKNKASPRATILSSDEMVCLESSGKQLFKIAFPEGNAKSYLLESHLTVKEVMRMIYDRYELKTNQD